MVATNSLYAWVLATRPKTLTGAAVPVMIGCALAAADGGFQPLPAALCLLFALLMQMDANLINDLCDYLKGSDGSDRLGPERACAQGWITPRFMRRGIALCTLIAAAVGCGLLIYGGWTMLPVGALCILFAFFYTAGPYPLAYHGWGDLLVIVFFGFIPVGCTYFVQCGTWGWQVAAASGACGLAIDTLLMVNNFRDREQDAQSGKRTLIVRFGAVAGRRFYLWLGLAALGCCLLLQLNGRTWAALLPLLYLPLHVRTWRAMVQIDHGRELNMLLGATSRNILLFGTLLSLGLLL
ncbi:MAG: 1,4-dihydroxy-2-naphthoate polyprenyltransferase [Alistipes sp.]